MGAISLRHPISLSAVSARRAGWRTSAWRTIQFQPRHSSASRSGEGVSDPLLDAAKSAEFLSVPMSTVSSTSSATMRSGGFSARSESRRVSEIDRSHRTQGEGRGPPRERRPPRHPRAVCFSPRKKKPERRRVGRQAGTAARRDRNGQLQHVAGELLADHALAAGGTPARRLTPASPVAGRPSRPSTYRAAFRCWA
jgi:hypothetical protein